MSEGNDDGVIKFKCTWLQSPPLEEGLIKEINGWRDKLYSLGLIGAYPNGIGYGNLSIRVGDKNQFIVTGTATGGIKKLTSEHYTTVLEFDIDKNIVVCKGPIKASSESMTHAAVFLSDPSIKAAIHVHNMDLWKNLLDKVPTTAKEAEYGTPEIANDVLRLFNETDVAEKKIIVLAGHEEGIITFGKDLEEAGSIIMRYYKDMAD